MKIKISIVLFLLFTHLIFAQQNETDRSWNQPVEPFRIIGNIYYVGASEITAFLITTPEGHILLDGGFAETVPQIKENVAKLGFKIEDIKFLLNSQAHYDHAPGLAELKRLTGAKMLASAEDKVLLENGGKGDFHFGDTFPYEPVKVDKIVKDNEKVKLGGTSLKALITPGHTKGCTTLTMTITENKRKYNVVFVCSTTIPGYNLVDNKNYPNIAPDYAKTFEKLKKLDVDVFLASHGNFFDLEEKSEKIRREREPNPFVDSKMYKEFIKRTEKQFQERLKKQKEESVKRETE